ncbi:MAG: multiheme c-type cytochrome [bacterium]
MLKKFKMIVHIIFVLALLAILLLFGFVAPFTLFLNTVEALREGGPVGTYTFMTIASLVSAVVFLILLNSIKRTVLAILDEKIEGMRGKKEEQETFKAAGKPKRKERILLIILIFLTAVLCITGYGQYTTLTHEEVYWRMSFVHIICGVLTFFILIFYLFHLLRRHFSLKVSLLVIFYPFIYLLILQSPGPLLANFIVLNLILLPLGIFFLARRETAVGQRLALAIASIALFAFVLVVMTGMSPVIAPTTVRFAFRHRLFHAYITPIAVLLPVYYYLWRRGGVAIKPKGAMRSLSIAGVLIFMGIACGIGMHKIKDLRLENIRENNQYLSARLATEKGASFRVMRPDLISDDKFCGECHIIPFRQWARSVHATAARITTFQKVVKSLMDKHGPEIALDCAACHDPEVMFLKDPQLLVNPEYMVRSQGVSCRVCHYMSHAGDKNAIYALQIPRSDLTPRPPLMRRLRILSAVPEHVNDVTKPITTNGEMCFPCHSLRSIRNGHELVPYDIVTSFQRSSFSRIMPCHRCHMPRIEKDERSYSWMDHTFFGIQEELSSIIIASDREFHSELEIFTRDTNKWIAGRLPVLEIVQAWMDESFKSYRFTGYISRRKQIEETIRVASGGSHFSMSLKKAAMNGSTLNLVLTTENLKAGHDFPSSLFANITEVWFELELTDARGQKIYSSLFNPNDLTRRIGRIEVDADGKPIAPSDSLKYVKIINWKFIEPDKGYDDTYSIPISTETQFPMEAVYRLNYRRYSDDFAKWFSEGKIDSFPVRVIAEKTFTINKSDTILGKK